MTLTQNTRGGIVKMVFGLFLVLAFACGVGRHASALSLDLQVPVIQPVVNVVEEPVNAILQPITDDVSPPVSPPSTPVTQTVSPSPAPTASSPPPATSTSPASSSPTPTSQSTSASPKTSHATSTAAFDPISAQPLILPFTSAQGGILSRDFGRIGLYPTTGAYGEQATGGMIQPSASGWIIFGIAWYWYVLAAVIIWLAASQAQKFISHRKPRRQIPVEFL